MRKFVLILLMVITVSVANFAYAGTTRLPDPSGTATGNVNDITAVTPGKPTQSELKDQVGHNKVAINMEQKYIYSFSVITI